MVTNGAVCGRGAGGGGVPTVTVNRALSIVPAIASLAITISVPVPFVAPVWKVELTRFDGHVVYAARAECAKCVSSYCTGLT